MTTPRNPFGAANVSRRMVVRRQLGDQDRFFGRERGVIWSRTTVFADFGLLLPPGTNGSASGTLPLHAGDLRFGVVGFGFQAFELPSQEALLLTHFAVLRVLRPLHLSALLRCVCQIVKRSETGPIYFDPHVQALRAVWRDGYDDLPIFVPG